jgi:glycosyltransferase involved in cell wall biosynthesis
MLKYIIITPARNEESNLPRLIECVIAQTQKPEKWVIVDDGSTDRTAEIADHAAANHAWIEVIHRPQHMDRSFAAKVQAFNSAYERIRSIDSDIVGNIDSDVSFKPDYFEILTNKFAADSELGVAGTPFTQDGGYDSSQDSFEGQNYVSGGCQLFRRKCFEEIGGYVPNRAGGIDWIAVMKARMTGWKVQSFQERRYHHYRLLGTAGKSKFRAAFEYGEKDYYLGGSPVWHFFRVLYRIPHQPVVFGSLGLFLGYYSAWARGMKRPVSDDLVQFHRQDQLKKLRQIVQTLVRFQKVDPFRTK